MSEEILAIEGVSKRYHIRGGLLRPARIFTALENVSLMLAAGDTLGIVGESGSGKSTLARIAAGIDTPSSGTVLFQGGPYAHIGSAAWRRERRGVQFIFQNPASALDPRATIRSQISEALDTHETLDAGARERRIDELLERVGLGRLGNRVPQQMSGGQLQRAVIARALVLRPRLLVCDEAVSALDVSVQAQIINLLVSLREEFGLSMIFITHDLGVARHISRRIAVMHRGQIVETGHAARLFANPAHPYTRKLIAAIPAATPAERRAREAAANDMHNILP